MTEFSHDTFISPFTWRYGSSEMRSIFSERHKRELLRTIWIALARAEAKAGLVTDEQIAELESRMATPEGAADAAIYEQHGALKKELDQVVDQWECVSMELEEAKG